MKIAPKNNCPLDNFNPCRELECAWFLQLRGANPNTGEDMDEWGCSIGWLPIIMMEGSQVGRQTGAAIESFRNEMVKANQTNLELLAHTSHLIPVKDVT